MSLRWHVAAALACALASPVQAQEAAQKKTFAPEGRLSLRHYIQVDDQEVPNAYPAPPAEGEDPPAEPAPYPTGPLGVVPSVTTLDVDVALRGIKGTGLGFLVDAEFRKDWTAEMSEALPLSENRLGLELGDVADRSLGRLRSEMYIKSAYAEFVGLADLLDLQLGRMLMVDHGQTWVDGLHIGLGGKDGGLAAGVFGGLNPDPLDYAIDPDYMGGGAHAEYVGDHGHIGAAFNFKAYKGKKDRAFVYSRAHWELFEGMFLSYQATLDLFGCGQDLKTGAIKIATAPEITSGFANVAWWVTPQVQFRLSLATWRNVPFVATTGCRADFEDELQALLDAQEVDAQRANVEKAIDVYRRYLGLAINQDPYYRGKLTTVFRFLDHYYAYNEVDFLQRDFDDATGSFVGFGLRDTDFLLTRTFFHLRFRFRDNFASDSTEALVEIRRQFGDLLTAGVSATQISGRSLALDFTSPGRDNRTPLAILQDRPDIPEGNEGVANELARAVALAGAIDRLDQAQDVRILSADVAFDLTDRLFLSLVYEATTETATAEETGGEGEEQELFIQAVNVRLTWRL